MNTCPPRRTSEASAGTMPRLRHVLEHFHAGHDVELAGRCRGELLGRTQSVLHLHAVLERVQFGDLQSSSAPCRSPGRARPRAPWPRPVCRLRNPHRGHVLPSSEARSSMKASRSGLSSCNGRNSPAGSHQRCARASNLAISPASTLGGDCIVADIPQAGRSRWEPMRSFQRVV